MKIVWNKYESLYEDKETGDKYRRTIGGIGWPYMDKPGFVLVMIEDSQEDFSLVGSPRHLHVVEEFESPVMEELYRTSRKWSQDYLLDYMYGDRENVNREIWDRCRQNDETRLDIMPPARLEKLNMVFLRQVVTRRTSNQKTLHFGPESMLPAYLREVGPADEIENFKLDHYPALSALGNVLIEVELGRVISVRGWSPPQEVSSSRWF